MAGGASKRSRGSTSRVVETRTSSPDELELESNSEEEVEVEVEEDENSDSEEVEMDYVHIRSRPMQATYRNGLDVFRIEPQRFASVELLMELDLNQVMQNMFTWLGSHILLTFIHPCYEHLTREFFSSFVVEDKDSSTCSMTMSFSLGNKFRSLTVPELNSILWGSRDVLDYTLDTDAIHKFWYEMSGRTNYVYGEALAADIVNPCFRIAHRIFANVLYGRHETSKVRNGDLVCLYNMVHRRLINIGWEMALRFLEVSKQKRGIICMGGIVKL